MSTLNARPLLKPSARHRRSNHTKSTPNTHASSNLRIIGGRWRGRKLSFTSAEGLRPTGDRVRETLFNWLMADVTEACCLDLFAGSGALGLEALSRGAQEVIFLDNHAPNVQQIQAHLTQLQCDQATALKADALLWLQQFESYSLSSKRFDIVFVDPPFQLDLWPQVLNLLDTQPWLAEDALVYVETPRPYSLAALSAPSHWQLHREKQAGDVCFRLFQT